MRNILKKNTKVGIERRVFLKLGAALSALTTASAAGVSTASARSSSTVSTKPFSAHEIFGRPASQRRGAVFTTRLEALRFYVRNHEDVQQTNGDDADYTDFRASFHKTLPHDDLGEVDPVAYETLRAALRSGLDGDFKNVSLDETVRTRKLANPQAAYGIDICGLDGQATRMPAAPNFASSETAAEMGELYWKAQLRDIPFIEYETTTDIALAVQDLNNFSYRVGGAAYGKVAAGGALSPDIAADLADSLASYKERHRVDRKAKHLNVSAKQSSLKQQGEISIETLFRGETAGDMIGPYISQFLLQDTGFGNATLVQRYPVPTAGVDFMTSYDNWLAVQRGGVPETLFKSGEKYIYNGRALGEYVHIDALFQAYLTACLKCLSYGADALDPSNPYLDKETQGGFVDFGGPHILDLVTKAGRNALYGAWYQKWLVHRRLRPETYGGRLHNQITGAKEYHLPDDLVHSEAVGRVFAQTGTYLLPMAFAEGSPTHPAYPAGHSTVAGACATVLKAFFNEEYVLPEAYVASATGDVLIPVSADLTLGNELDKLASNVTLGRDWAGVHYRSDGIKGMDVGEAQGIELLREYSRVHREAFDGFTLTRFNGRKVIISNGNVVDAVS